MANNALHTVGEQKFAPVVSPSGKAPQVGLAKKGFDQRFKMFDGVVIVDDLNGMREVIEPHFFQTKRPIHEHHHFFDAAHSASQSLTPQADAKVRRTFKSGQIRGGLMIA